ncbi:MAG: TatD family hydrolase [Armatimonadetes bacterium]|nr:TatD family hydrolase [Armatimonadota bacterium]
MAWHLVTIHNVRLFDTHCHLYDSEAYPDPHQVVEEALRSGVNRMVLVGIDLATSERAIELAHRFEGLYASVGWHPNHARTYHKGALNQMVELAKDPKVVAWGEIGLDYHWDFATPDQQSTCLRDQLLAAQSLDLPVIFHCREAYPSLLDILEQDTPRQFVLHCFAGTMEDRERASHMGAFFGVDGPITYKKADSLREIISTMPQDRILLETDAPYLAPHPLRGRVNTPANLPLINEKLAELLGMEPSFTAEMTTTNAERFYRL